MDEPVSIRKLNKISKKLARDFFYNTEIYALLVLGLVTVNTYSKKYNTLTPEGRIEVTLTYLPDLANYLLSKKLITEDEYRALIKQIKSRQADLLSILKSYLYVSIGIHTRLVKAKRQRRGCF